MSKSWLDGGASNIGNPPIVEPVVDPAEFLPIGYEQPRRRSDQFNSPDPALPKLMVIGYGRHGKDTVCELLEPYGFSFISSSLFCAEKVILPAFMADGNPNGYENVDDCYADRHNNRAYWFDKISEYNHGDASRLGRAIFAEYDIYCGLRNVREFRALKNRAEFDFSIWVDRSMSQPPEDKSSCTLEPWMADYVLDNNGDPDELKRNLGELMATIFRSWAERRG